MNILKEAIISCPSIKLESDDSISIDFDDYQAILGMVQKRPEKLPLVIEISNNCSGEVNVPEEKHFSIQKIIELNFSIVN